jgi:hypothetical protein
MMLVMLTIQKPILQTRLLIRSTAYQPAHYALKPLHLCEMKKGLTRRPGNSKHHPSAYVPLPPHSRQQEESVVLSGWISSLIPFHREIRPAIIKHEIGRKDNIIASVMHPMQMSLDGS